MSGAEMLRMLWETTLATSAACLLALALRRPVRRLAGARVGYALWAMVPAAAIAVLLPAPVRIVALRPLAGLAGGVGAAAPVPGLAGFDASGWLLAAWSAGAAWFAWRLWRRQRQFLRSLGTLRRRDDGLWQADAVDGLPAVFGLRPKVVVPADFETRFATVERMLMVAHERQHARRGDLLANAFAAALHGLHWFNPLLPFALARFRRDQELACDQSVLACHPGTRRIYGEAMLKAGGVPAYAPLACQWSGIHPLKERIAMLATPQPALRRRIAGGAVVLAVTSVLAYGAWAQQPQRIELPTATADAGAAEAGVPADVRNRKLTLQTVEMPAEAVARQVAGELGLAFQGPMPHEERKLTLDFRDVSAASVLQILADETRSRAQVSGGRLRFVPMAPAGSPGAAAQPAPRDGGPQVGVRSKAATPPRYPAAAFEAGITGKVILLVDVAADGSVADVQVETSQPQGVFDQVTLDAARQWRFEPAMKGGKPVAGRIRVPVTFEMDPPAAAQPVQWGQGA